MIKRLKEYLKNKKGETNLIFVFSMLFLFWIILFIIDLFRLTYIQLDATSLMIEVADIVSSQGGISTQAPSQYPSGRVKYINSEAVNKLVNNTMARKGVLNGDVTIRGEKVGGGVEEVRLNNNTDISIDYGNEIVTELRYGFDFISIPNLSNRTYDMVLTISRTTVSKYKHRNENNVWEGV